MKKFLVIVVVLLVVPVVLFASWKSTADYKEYLGLKEKGIAADGEGDTATAVANYKAAAALAGKSATADIQGWRLNDAAYTLIMAFKKVTNYQEKIDKLSAMEPSKEKLAYQKEIADFFSLQAGLLDEAEAILNDAKALNTTAPAEKIQSNADYIAWVKEFIKNNTADAAAEKKEAEAPAEKAQTETK